MIEAISHATFIVRDLEKMKLLIVDILGGREVYASGSATFSIAPERFFVLGGVWIAAMQGEPLSERTYNHVAFKTSEAELPIYREKIASAGLEIVESRSRVEGEGQSLYFYDFDNHLFELHTGTLEGRLQRYSSGPRPHWLTKVSF
jgi:catechol 2,3-dioxygenase-like lactoylglutathione lyase family enzyme